MLNYFSALFLSLGFLIPSLGFSATVINTQEMKLEKRTIVISPEDIRKCAAEFYLDPLDTSLLGYCRTSEPLIGEDDVIISAPQDIEVPSNLSSQQERLTQTFGWQINTASIPSNEITSAGFRIDFGTLECFATLLDPVNMRTCLHWFLEKEIDYTTFSIVVATPRSKATRIFDEYRDGL